MPNINTGNNLSGEGQFSTQDHFGVSGAQMQNTLTGLEQKLQQPGGLDHILNSPSFDFKGFEANVNKLGTSLNTFGSGTPNWRKDRDGDGDYDSFDRTITDAENNGTPLTLDERVNLANANSLHEFIEDVQELFDNNPNNDSFFDGGNGSGKETPLP
jgi:hypothetical protein